MRAVLKAVCGVLFRVRIDGSMAGVDTARLLVIANHESFLDGLLLGLFDYLAVDPTSPMAMKKVIKLLDSGRPVVIFPEGRITNTGSLMKVYDGPAFVAAKTGATI